VRIWDPEAGTTVHALHGHHGDVTAVAVSADGRRAVSGGSDGTVRIWDPEAGTTVHTLTGHDSRVTAVAVSADGRRAVSSGDDWMVRVWDVAHGMELASFASESAITDLAITPPGTRVIAGTSTGPVHFLELCNYERPPAHRRSPDRGTPMTSGHAPACQTSRPARLT
jgi:WD40 repeat protein